jgi:hypothetical protein
MFSIQQIIGSESNNVPPSGFVGSHGFWKSINLVLMMLLNHLGQDKLQHSVSNFPLSIFPRVVWSRHLVLDLEFLGNGVDKLRSELVPLVGD